MSTSEHDTPCTTRGLAQSVFNHPELHLLEVDPGERYVIPVEVRSYILCFGCLVRNAGCNTMSHLNTDAGCSYMSRAKRIM